MLTGSLQENILTLLCWNDECARRLVARGVTGQDFSTVAWRKLAQAAIEHVGRYDVAVGVHLRDKVEKELRHDKDGLMELALANMAHIHESIQPDFVMDHLDEFKALRSFAKLLDSGVDAQHRENLAECVEVGSQFTEWARSQFLGQSQAIPTISTLLGEELPPLRYLLDKLVPEGLTLVAGPPKIGKSLFTLQLALACATGGMMLGQRAQPCAVLYVDLEGNKPRLQMRSRMQMDGMAQLAAGITKPVWQHEIHYQFRVPTLDEGLIGSLSRSLDSHPDIKVIIIDIWAKVAGAIKQREQQYTHETRMIGKVQQFAVERNVSVLIVHHTKKQKSEDALEEVYGGHGLTGSVDTIIVLGREPAEGFARLRSKGRDLVDEEDAMLFRSKETLLWEVIGTHSEAAGDKRDTMEGQILALLKSMEVASPGDIAERLLPRGADSDPEELRRKKNCVKVCLSKLRKRNLVTTNGGYWALVILQHQSHGSASDAASDPDPGSEAEA